MRLLHVYLGVYFLLVAAAFFTLWRSGILARLPRSWVIVAALVSFSLGVLLAVASRRGEGSVQPRARRQKRPG